MAGEGVRVRGAVVDEHGDRVAAGRTGRPALPVALTQLDAERPPAAGEHDATCQDSGSSGHGRHGRAGRIQRGNFGPGPWSSASSGRWRPSATAARLALGGDQAARAPDAARAARQRDAQPRAADRRAVGRAPAGDGAKAVQVHMSRLRKALGDAAGVIVTREHRLPARDRPRGARREPLRARSSRRPSGRLADRSSGRRRPRSRTALALWRGAPLVGPRPRAVRAAATIDRLEDLRLAGARAADRGQARARPPRRGRRAARAR